MVKKKAKKWYAIKNGKGVQNKILTSWTECEKLVIEALQIVFE